MEFVLYLIQNMMAIEIVSSMVDSFFQNSENSPLGEPIYFLSVFGNDKDSVFYIDGECIQDSGEADLVSEGGDILEFHLNIILN